MKRDGGAVEASAVVAEAAASQAPEWPEVERRRAPRIFRRRHEARVEWKHIAVYVPVLLLVIAVGAFAIWSFLERQSLVIDPAPLPKVTLITANADAPVTAAWVRLLGDAELQSTLVPLDKVDQLRGVAVLCNIPEVPAPLQARLDAFIRRGGAVVVLGDPPANAIGPLELTADSGMSDTSFEFSEVASPILARLDPGYQVQVHPVPVTFLQETPRMIVDARWKENARAAIVHMQDGPSRFLWFGFDPQALPAPDRQLNLLLRTAFRWVAGQPVSDGAVGPAQVARGLTPESRETAHTDGFAFSFDRLPDRGEFRLTMINRGTRPLQNPTVKVWLPPGVQTVSLGGDFIMRRGARVTSVPEEGACLIALPSLRAHRERVMKLEVVR